MMIKKSDKIFQTKTRNFLYIYIYLLMRIKYKVTRPSYPEIFLEIKIVVELYSCV